jgi:hypothetical protein
LLMFLLFFQFFFLYRLLSSFLPSCVCLVTSVSLFSLSLPFFVLRLFPSLF